MLLCGAGAAATMQHAIQTLGGKNARFQAAGEQLDSTLQAAMQGAMQDIQQAAMSGMM